jgi:hypothetical protein
MRHPLQFTWLVLLIWALVPHDAWARVKLITLPVRERIDIQLEHPDVTLVEEERLVPLVAGTNEIDFSWANTRIDPGSIVFRLVNSDQGEAGPKVLSVSYPPAEKALIWQVHSPSSGAARVRISYVLGGLGRRYAYRAVASLDETRLDLLQYLRIENFGNEGFESSRLWIAPGKAIDKSIGIDETKKILVARYDDVPLRKTLSCNPAKYGYSNRAKNQLRIPIHYVLRNRAASGLGASALAPGKIRIFQEDGHGGRAFLGEDWAKHAPVDDELALFIGEARDLSVRRVIARRERTRIAGELHDYDVVVRYVIENFKDEPVTLDIIEDLVHLRDEVRGSSPRDVEYVLQSDSSVLEGLDPEKSDQQKLVFHVELPPRDGEHDAREIVHTLHVRFKNEW